MGLQKRYEKKNPNARTSVVMIRVLRRRKLLRARAFCSPAWIETMDVRNRLAVEARMRGGPSIDSWEDISTMLRDISLANPVDDSLAWRAGKKFSGKRRISK